MYLFKETMIKVHRKNPLKLHIHIWLKKFPVNTMIIKVNLKKH